MSTNPQATIIDFGSSKIVVMVAEQGVGGMHHVLACASVPYNGYRDGRWNDSDAEVNAAIATAVAEARAHLVHAGGTDFTQVYVGVPGSCIQVHHSMAESELKGRRIAGSDIDGLMDQAMTLDVPGGYAVLHRCPAWFKVDDVRTMEPLGQKGRTIMCKCGFILAETRFLEDVQRRLAALGLTVADSISSTLAVALMVLSPEERDRGAIVIDAGYLYTEVSSVEGDALLFHHAIPMGGGHITADVAFGLELPMAQAELVKRAFSLEGAGDGPEDGKDRVITIEYGSGQTRSFPREEVAAVLEPRVEEISDEIMGDIARSGLDMVPRAVYYLAGCALSGFQGGREFLSNRLERSLKVPTPRPGRYSDASLVSAMGLLDMAFEVIEMDKSSAKKGPFASIGKFLKTFVTK